MTQPHHRPRALLAIVFYKCFTSGLLSAISLGLLLSVAKYDDLMSFTDEYTIAGKWEIIKWGLNKLTAVPLNKIELGAIATGIYAIVSAIEAIGLWYEQLWATVIVVLAVGLSIPVEVYEILHKVSALKILVFIINIVMFLYLLRHAIEEHRKHKSKLD